MSEFVFERADGTKFVVSGYEQSDTSGQEIQEYSSDRYSEADLPKKVDLRPYMTPVENQMQSNSCTANAVAGAYEYLAKQHLGTDYDVSRLFIYYNARDLSPRYQEMGEIKDDGSAILLAIKGLKEFGGCSEQTYPFDLKHVNDKPDDEAYEEAAQFLVEEAISVPIDLLVWKKALAEGHPIIFGAKTFPSFHKPKKKGVIPMPSKNEGINTEHGLHAMLAVGYSDVDQMFIVRNSWGEEWGDKGYCYMPYKYLINKEYNSNDCWIIKQLNDAELPEQEEPDYWDDDEESIIGEYDSELANMSDEHYEAMLEAMGDVPFEYRLGLLFLLGASADGEISDEEYEAISTHMQGVLEALGSELEASKILRRAIKDIDNEELVQESVILFGEHFSQEFLAKIVSDLEELVSADDLSEEETEFLHQLVNIWQSQSGSHEEEDDSEEEGGRRRRKNGRDVQYVYEYVEVEEEPEEDDYSDLVWRGGGPEEPDRDELAEEEAYDDEEEPEEEEAYEEEEPEEEEAYEEEEEPEEEEAYDEEEEPEEEESYEEEEPEEEESYDEPEADYSDEGGDDDE